MPRFAMQLREALNRKLMNEAGGAGDDGGGMGGGDAGGSDNNGSDTGGSDGGQDDGGFEGDGGDAGSDGGMQLSAEQLHDYKSKYADDEGNLNVDQLISDLHQGQAGGDAPEAYDHEFLKSDEALKDYDIPVDDDPLIQSAMKWAKENGVSQDKYQGLITGAMTELKTLQEAQAKARDEKLQEAWGRIDDSDARKQKLTGQMSALFGDDLKNDVSALIEHPNGFLILERLAAKVRDPQINDQQYRAPEAISRDGIQSLRVERDKAEKSGDKSKVREIEKKISAAYKRLDEAGKL